MIEAAYIVRARMLLERALRRRWASGLIASDEGSKAAIERLLEPSAAHPDAGPALIPDHVYGSDDPVGRFSTRLALSASETDLIAVLLACEADPIAGRLITYLGGPSTPFTLTFDLLLEIVYSCRRARHSETAELAAHDLAPDRVLRRLRYVSVGHVEQRVMLGQTVRLYPRVAAWLLGNERLDADLAARAHLSPPFEPSDEMAPKDVDQVVAAFRAGGKLLLVQGPPRSGRETLCRIGAARVGRPLLVVEGRNLSSDQLVAAFREASLRGALLVLRDAGEALAGENWHRFRDGLDAVPDTVALIGIGSFGPALAQVRSSTTVTLAVPTIGDRARLWARYLGAGSGITKLDLQHIASIYNLGIDGIAGASRLAREAAGDQPVGRRHLAAAVRQLFDADLAQVANRVEVTQSWADIVLPEDIEESVHAIIDRVRLRAEVLGRQGFARKLGKGLGLTVLLSGEPGTGKSMVAGLVAAELGLDLYVVDLARITSKWLGETEKNLSRAFDAAEAGHVLLLFDEADSVLAKRSSVESSNDRHANLETNFILARLEQFHGIAFFTTNLASSVDPAVSRRMSVHVKFPFPDRDLRAVLWRRMIPSDLEYEADIDFDDLADRYDVSGGFIRNIVLRAAFLAARDQRALAMIHLRDAADSEYRERGMLASGGRLA
jgi:hypothetical protein